MATIKYGYFTLDKLGQVEINLMDCNNYPHEYQEKNGWQKCIHCGEEKTKE